MRATGDEQSLRLRVTALVWEAEGVLSVHLSRADGAHLPPWTPGAHLDLHLPSGLTRQYSLSGSPADRSTWRLSVLREPASRGGSREVHEVLRPGDHIEVTGPRNNFALPEDDALRYRFIAGGIGITPLLPMIERVASSGADWSLLYGGRSRSSMAFLADLARHGERVLVRPQDEFGLLDLDAYLGPPSSGTSVFCCGPEPLLAATEQVCGSWPPGTLHVERFTAQPYDVGAEDDAAFEVVLHRTGRSVTVPAGRSVLDALEEHGIDVPNSCREGICGTCETKVVAGVPDHRDSLLSPEERAANDTMMICVGRARGPRLTLDL
ncbi:PDR/VanB family oxidoreductase [Streptomyces cavernicola]|uniref:PDR/VanB family oxidoreductase n=1 Tax=Streptomyces cavernicola TaxID=3043613 RepID=A0ABT6S7A4_9ACTN|nr:PDR/VanB family oxidoreductase [Streptomyces sp. B-S-A6]MDI3403313.1 PDR/VanB family oxidoreductase [Streptomyces sp. B-S-A6]